MLPAALEHPGFGDLLSQERVFIGREPEAAAVALGGQLLGQQDDLLGPAGVRGKEDGGPGQVILGGLPGTFRGDGEIQAPGQGFADGIFRRKDAAGALAGKHQPSGGLDFRGHLGRLAGVEFSAPRPPYRAFRA